MKLRVGVTSDIGRVRTNNEDAYLVDPPVFAVADGMGGMEAGEIASSLAMDTLRTASGPGSDGDVDLGRRVRLANDAIWQRAEREPELTGMGTTLTAVAAEGDHLRLAHVGDSRAYMVRDGRLRQLTEDHTRVHRMVLEGVLTAEEAATHPDRNILSRALGIRPEISVDEEAIEVQPGDRILLCSDGLYGMVEEATIEEILASRGDPQRASELLVEKANDQGGVDNVTAIVLDVQELGPGLIVEGPSGVRRSGADAGRPSPEARGPAGAASTHRAAGGNRSWLLAALLVLLGVAAAGVLLWVFLGRQGTASPSPSATTTRSAQDFANRLDRTVRAHSGLIPPLRAATAGHGPAPGPALAERAASSAASIRGLLPPPSAGQPVRLALISARDLLASSFTLYAEAARLIRDSAVSPPVIRPALVEQARSALALADRAQKSGYDTLATVAEVPASTIRPGAPSPAGASSSQPSPSPQVQHPVPQGSSKSSTP